VGKKEKTAFISWTDRYALKVPLIDNQHKELIKLTNALYDTCRGGSESAKDGFRKAAHAVVEYIKVHFSTEEQIMERVDYPEAAAHKEKHKAFIRMFLDEVKAFEDGKSFVPNEFANILREWTLTHIAITDKQLGDHLLAMAKKGEFNLGLG